MVTVESSLSSVLGWYLVKLGHVTSSQILGSLTYFSGVLWDNTFIITVHGMAI